MKGGSRNPTDGDECKETSRSASTSDWGEIRNELKGGAENPDDTRKVIYEDEERPITRKCAETMNLAAELSAAHSATDIKKKENKIRNAKFLKRDLLRNRKE